MESYPVFTTALSSKVSKDSAAPVTCGYATCADFCRVFNDTRIACTRSPCC